jgi:hypothetical protein
MTRTSFHNKCVLINVALVLLLSAATAVAQTTSFTYQGRLTDSGASANGNYDLQFTLWDALSGGTQQPQPSPVTATRSAVAVANGIFTVQLDFGASAFPGANRFLEIGARLSGVGAFTILSPRQPITPTPYAIRSLNASSADAVTVNGVPGGSGNYIQNSASAQASSNFNISGNGTAGGTLSGGTVNATTQYNIGGTRVLSFGVFGVGQANLFVGFDAGQNTTGFDNSFVGANSGFSNTSGRHNSFFGVGAGVSNVLGGSNTAIGYVADVGSGSLTNATAIGANARVDQSDALVLGSIAGINGASASVNVGIGTPAPLSKLDIVATGDGAELLRFSTERPWVFRQIRTGPSTGLQLRSTSGQKAFEITTVDGINVATFLADSTASKVGIGTTSPAHRLSVIGGPSWTSSFWNGSMEFGNASAIGWQANTAGWHFGIGQTNGGLYFFRTSSELGSTLSPVTYDMALTDGGLVGIGTTAPDNKLTVNGAADKPGGGSWGTFSDERLKNIKGRFTPGLKAVLQLKPLRYEYKPDNALGLKLEGEQVGFSAQAVQRVIPEAVTKNDKGYLLVNNDPIMWTMLNAIKEQQNQIESLRTANALMQKNNAALNARLRSVENVLRKKVGSPRRRR